MPGTGTPSDSYTRTISASATFDIAGNATATIDGPATSRRWTLTSAVVLTSAGAPICRLYRNAALPANALGGTFSGALDTAQGAEPIRPGERLLAVWSGGTYLATATVNVTVDDQPAWP
jgi:hypothetical protein